MRMEFCKKCGTRLIVTKEGLLCRRCQVVVPSEDQGELKKEKRSDDTGRIYVITESAQEHARVSRSCPVCGNRKAFHWLSGISGEHAGVRQERTVQHFKCTKCSYSWTEES